ncbi:hypothetical protein ACIP79_08170 [Streptomyces sp. NPDC088747]|uniref:hypothetical protein n=1 Tax=Streptomyces sp. NPDC088747 TaxID=3365886 RepID=UPI0038219F66
MTTNETDTTPCLDRGSYAWCAWHKGVSDDTRLVRIVEQGSAFGGGGLFACRPCRNAYDLVPLADQPAPEKGTRA